MYNKNSVIWSFYDELFQQAVLENPQKPNIIKKKQKKKHLDFCKSAKDQLGHLLLS